jgi:hypothetical protein
MVLLAASPAWAVADDPPKAPALTDAQKERLRERDRFGKQSQKLQTEGRLPEAIAAAEAMLAIERDVLGETSEDAIGSLERLARLNEARDDWPAVTVGRALVLALRSKSLGVGHWKAIDDRFALSRAESIGRLDRGGPRRFAEARTLFTKAGDLYSKARHAEAMKPAQRIF